MLAIIALIAGGCGSTGAAATSTSVMPTPAAARASGACGSAPLSSTTLAPEVAGRTRTVIVHLPSGYAGLNEVPMVLNLHGSGSTASGQEQFSGMDATADADGFIVAYPQALIPDGSGFDWNVPGVPLTGGRPVPAGAADDIGFLTELVGLLEHDYCIDPARVYATGFSGGARTASQLGCDASTVFAAIAPVSGLRDPDPCRATRAIPVIAFHGTADPIDPFGGNGQAYWTYSVLQAAQDWARQDGCTLPASSSQPDPGVTLTTYAGCRSGSSVELYAIDSEGHEWPGGPQMPRSLTRVLGPQSDAINADQTMWAFFAAHPMPGS